MEQSRFCLFQCNNKGFYLFHFIKLDLPKDRRVIPDEVKQWVKELEQLYSNPGETGARVKLTGDGCAGYIYPMDASNMMMDVFKVGFDDLPIVKLAIIDLPEVSCQVMYELSACT